jgi:CBS domain-containing protein
MSPRSVSDALVRDTPVLTVDDPIEAAVRRLLDSDLPALPVVDAKGQYAGIFGEREFVAAVFPGYLSELRYAGFVPRALEDALQKRAACRNDPVREHMNTEHVDVTGDFSDAQIAETFLHHRVLVIPVVNDRRVTGVITRSDFFHVVAERLLNG